MLSLPDGVGWAPVIAGRVFASWGLPSQLRGSLCCTNKVSLIMLNNLTWPGQRHKIIKIICQTYLRPMPNSLLPCMHSNNLLPPDRPGLERSATKAPALSHTPLKQCMCQIMSRRPGNPIVMQIIMFITHSHNT